MTLCFRAACCAFLFFFPGLIQGALSATVRYDFNVTWVWANPDGRAARPVIGVNGEWPVPQINASVGDRVIVNVLNSLGNQTTAIHFHGLYMNGTSHMDGTTYVTQCAIEPGAQFKYDFEVQQPGTYWYHSHVTAQYPDGLRGMLVVSDPESPYRSQYDEEIILSTSDWYHGRMADLVAKFDETSTMMPMEPAPDSSLVNDKANSTVQVKPGKTYLVRLANIGAYAGQYFWIEGHTMRIVEVDGVYTEAAEAEMIYISVGQRYSFLLTTKDDASANYPIRSKMNSELYASKPDGVDDAFSWLVYDSAKPLPEFEANKALSRFEDKHLVPYDRQPLLEPVDHSITLGIGMGRGPDGHVHWMFNDSQYEAPDVPSIFAALVAGPNATNPGIYGNSQPIVLEHNKIIEIVLRNGHMLEHPIHLHGHAFQVISGGSHMHMVNFDEKIPEFPVRRDTTVLRMHGVVRIRFRADNPGLWLIHCHMEWHAHSGLMATVIEAPLELQRQPRIAKLVQNIGTQRVCPAGQISDGFFDEADVETSGQPIFIYAAGAAGVSIVVAAAAVWYFYRKRAQKSQEYSLVPLKDTEAPAKLEESEA